VRDELDTDVPAADGLGPVRAARRMVEWLQKPLLKNPPAFPDHGTGKANL
jgi:hypothetical protein